MLVAPLGTTIVAQFVRVPPLLRCAVVIAIVVPLVLWLRLPTLARAERCLRSRWTPFVVGALSSGAMAFAWASLRHVPFVHDEAAYLLQAHLFAAGRWADPAPPVPVFFEQPHVLVTPRFAAKYPPGHALLLTPGIWVHLPGLVPVLLLGVTGGLLFALTREVLPKEIGPWAAAVAWIGWVGMVGDAGYERPSYMSEMTTGALWMLGWWALLRWRDRGRLRYLLLLAVVVAWGAITRPLTMLAYGLPVGVVVLILAWRRRAWRQLVIPGVAGLAVLALIPVWSWRTTGDWRETPLTLYTRQYLPWDVLGFGFRTDPPTRAVPPEETCFIDQFGLPRRNYTPEALPAVLAARATALAQTSFTDWRVAAAPFAAVALFFMPPEVAFAVGTCILLLLAYLAYDHDPAYTLYYMETQTTVAAVAALGLTGAAFAFGRRFARFRSRDDASTVGRSVVAWCALVLCVLAVWPTLTTLRGIRWGREIGDLPHRMFQDTVAALPDRRNIVFVQFRPGEACKQNLIENTPPLETARTWVVYDRGREDQRLMQAAPDRIAYRFDAHTWVRSRLTLDSTFGDSAARRERQRGRLPSP